LKPDVLHAHFAYPEGWCSYIALRNIDKKVPLMQELPALYVDYEGFKFYAKIRDYRMFVKPYEPLTHRFLASFAEATDTFLKVGAHAGVYSIKLARKVSKVITLEPHPKYYSFLRRNLVLNDVTDKVINGMSNLLDRNPPRITVVEINKKKDLDLLRFFIERDYKSTILDCCTSSVCNYRFVQHTYFI